MLQATIFFSTDGNDAIAMVKSLEEQGFTHNHFTPRATFERDVHGEVVSYGIETASLEVLTHVTAVLNGQVGR